jgi:molybdopterin-guanine dinucleotide biosynthesis protein MobB
MPDQNPIDSPVPLLGFAAWSGTGKTTLIAALLPLLTARGLRVAVIKHAHHSVEPDQPGKDSHVLRKAGAAQVLLTSAERWAMFADRPERREPELAEELQRLPLAELDLVLVEGFKHCQFSKIELHRAAIGRPLLYPDDADIIAIASDGPLPDDAPAARLDLNQPEQIAAFICERLPNPDRSQP